MSEFKIEIPHYVKKIMDEIKRRDFEAYIVGGCVRDSILNVTPKDWDVITNARPEDVKEMFDCCSEIGLKYGAITVFLNGQKVEVATYRIDKNYVDGRHPESVFFVDNLDEDLKRRDFTMNALAYNDKEGLRDIFGGIKDINLKIIKVIGKAQNRFCEDYLRMLRAVRFGCQCGFELNEEIKFEIKKSSYLIQNLEVSLIRSEFDKMLLSDFPQKMKLLVETGLDKYIVPGFAECFCVEQTSKYHIFNVGDHIMEVLRNIEPGLELRLSAFFHDFGKIKIGIKHGETVHFKDHQIVSCVMANEIMLRLGYGFKIRRKVMKLIEFHDAVFDIDFDSIKNAVHAVGGITQFKRLLKLQRADSLGKNLEYLSKKIEYIKTIESVLDKCYK
ncbi:MAG: CCA tRNA nucleotidyltransferase [Clostridiales bacterium]|nr:CCA tRNA nucleotidyltransferase [Clostridiales bacterium]